MEKFSLDEMQLDLLKKGIIDLKGVIDQDMLEYVRDCFVWLTASGSPDICVMISSVGGSVTFGLIIYDLIRVYEGKSVGMVLGGAHSMAACILQACKNRRCTRGSSILIHYLRPDADDIRLNVLQNRRKLSKIIKLLEPQQEKLFLILERTRKSRSEIAAQCSKDEMMTAEEALAFGLIDEII